MDKEELFKKRDEYSLKSGRMSVFKRKFGILSITFLITTILLFVINVSIHASYIDQNVEMPQLYFIFIYVCIGLLILGIITLIIYMVFSYYEKKYRSLRDHISYNLTGEALKHIETEKEKE